MFKNKLIILGLALVSVLALSTMVATPALAGKGGKGGGKAIFLITDIDTIDNGTESIEAISDNDPFCGKELGTDPPMGHPATCVNDDLAIDAGSGLTTPLFTRAKDDASGGWDITPYSGLVLPTGQISGEGLFSVGLSDADLAAFINDTLPNAELDSIVGSPLGEAEINDLLGKVVCAKVKDSDVSVMESGLLNAQGAYRGLTAFQVTAVGVSVGSDLPPITVTLLAAKDVQKVCDGATSGSSTKGGGGNGGGKGKPSK